MVGSIFSKVKMNNRGMSLVEIVVAVGVFGLLATVFSTSFVEAFKTQKNIEIRDKANDLASSVGRFLHKDSSCQAGLQGVRLPVTGQTSNLTLNNYVGYGSDDNPIALTNGSRVSDQVEVSGLFISNAGTPAEQVTSGGVTYDRQIAKIELRMRVLEAGNWKDTPSRFFEVPVYTNGGNIQRCSVELQEDDVCQVTGSVFNPATGQCSQQTQCSFQGHYARTTCSTPNNGCPTSESMRNEFTNAYHCPNGSTQSRTGRFTWTYQESCGKKCTRTVTVTQEFFVCLECN